MQPTLRAGQRWSYRAPEGFEASRIVIGAILSFDDGDRVVCCSVTGAPQRGPDGGIGCVTIPFLPMSEEAFARTIVACEGEDAPADEFAAAYAVWKADARGLSCFSVPFDGFLDRLIARQMAEIVGADV